MRMQAVDNQVAFIKEEYLEGTKMKSFFLLVACVLVVFVSRCCSFRISSYRVNDGTSLYAKQRRQEQSSTSALENVALYKPSSMLVVASTLVSVFGLPMPTPTTVDSMRRTPLAAIVVPDANADFRAAQKRTYFRYVPKFSEGLQYFKDLKPALEKEDYTNAEKLFEVYVTKYNPNDQSIDATDFYADFHYYKPMQVMSGTFAEKGTSEKQRQLSEQLEKFKKAMFKMENCFKDMKEGGFFSATLKKPTGGEKKKQALQAWKEGKEALDEYISIFNLGLMREVNPIENPLL